MRRRILQVSVSATLVFLVVAALALWQAGEARRQRNLAQARQMPKPAAACRAT